MSLKTRICEECARVRSSTRVSVASRGSAPVNASPRVRPSHHAAAWRSVSSMVIVRPGAASAVCSLTGVGPAANRVRNCSISPFRKSACGRTRPRNGASHAVMPRGVANTLPRKRDRHTRLVERVESRRAVAFKADRPWQEAASHRGKVSRQEALGSRTGYRNKPCVARRTLPRVTARKPGMTHVYRRTESDQRSRRSSLQTVRGHGQLR